MKYTVVLNGCSDSFVSQAQEINNFLYNNNKDFTEGRTVIFYSAEEKREELISGSPLENILMIKVKGYQPENILKILEKTESGDKSDLYLFPGDFSGSELSVRFSVRMKGSSLAGTNNVKMLQNGILCSKFVYLGNMKGDFILYKKPWCLSLAKGTGYREVPDTGNKIVHDIDMTEITEDSFIKEYKFEKEEKESGLEHAKFILAAGKGVKSREKMKAVEEIARRLGAEVGVSRPVATSAFAPMNQLIGVSGAMTSPELCIIAGASGASAFFSGVEKSEFIISVNTDERAFVVKSSDVAIIDDYEKILEELVKLIADQ
ncbi:FAD-binding protein [Sebaldella sp. S0638]|uniref:FAD-binding protein n=1 Tax=Sebaldella sp. S0638 TaxID=2957809 RepID=UPI0020A22DB1|nr:FAD-binding protein [Sebaldella sp. S0638]MCP1223624.1 FAD-binding protein [Sebaldella sp. S0638]